jgi:hypothetical protein
MSSRSNGLFSTVLMLVPLLAVPALAIFGIPQFVPVVASTTTGDEDFDLLANEATGVGESACYTPDGLVTPFATVDNSPTDRSRNSTRYSVDAGAAWDDPFGDGKPSILTSPHELRADLIQVSEDIETSNAPNQGVQEPIADALIDSFDGWKPKSDHWLSIPARTRSTENQETRPQYGTECAESEAPEPTGHSEALETSGLEDHAADPIVSSDRAIRRESSTLGQGPLTWQAAVERLNALGVQQFRLLPGIEKNTFHFSCFYTPSDNPRVNHRFEAEANAPLRAVGSVLAQIDQWVLLQ